MCGNETPPSKRDSTRYQRRERHTEREKGGGEREGERERVV